MGAWKEFLQKLSLQLSPSVDASPPQGVQPNLSFVPKNEREKLKSHCFHRHISLMNYMAQICEVFDMSVRIFTLHPMKDREV